MLRPPEKEQQSSDRFDVIVNYEQKLNEYLAAIFYEGLDKEDYQEILEIIKDLRNVRSSAYGNLKVFVDRDKKLLKEAYEKLKIQNNYTIIINKLYQYKIHEYEQSKSFLEFVEDLKQKYDKLEMVLKNAITPETLNDDIEEEGSLIHLVYTNNTHNKIKPFSRGGYMFLCQFHNEQTPSYGVINHRGFAFCYGCGALHHMATYIMEYEGLSYEDSLQLLARIYLIDIENNSYNEDDPLVKKYQTTLLSEEYRNLLEKGYLRELNRNKEQVQYESDFAIKKFEQDFETIERIRRREYIKFGEKLKQERLILELPNFE